MSDMKKDIEKLLDEGLALENRFGASSLSKLERRHAERYRAIKDALPRWISVEDGPPPDKGEMWLTSFENGLVRENWRKGDGWYIDEADGFGKVLAYRPLPAPYTKPIPSPPQETS